MSYNNSIYWFVLTLHLHTSLIIDSITLIPSKFWNYDTWFTMAWCQRLSCWSVPGYWRQMAGRLELRSGGGLLGATSECGETIRSCLYCISSYFDGVLSPCDQRTRYTLTLSSEQFHPNVDVAVWPRLGRWQPVKTTKVAWICIFYFDEYNSE